MRRAICSWHSYAESIIGGAEMTKEERFEMGANYSMTHVDFMVGILSLTLSVSKRWHGGAVLIKGEWAVDL